MTFDEKIKRHRERVREGEGRRETVSKSSLSNFLLFRVYYANLGG